MSSCRAASGEPGLLKRGGMGQNGRHREQIGVGQRIASLQGQFDSRIVERQVRGSDRQGGNQLGLGLFDGGGQIFPGPARDS